MVPAPKKSRPGRPLQNERARAPALQYSTSMRAEDAMRMGQRWVAALGPGREARKLAGGKRA
eukprot:2349212-Rhodomonas_salina.2